MKRKEEAKADYDAAVSSGLSAFLLEESGRPDIFQISVGRLAPGATATLLLTYITEVPLDEAAGSSQARLTIPTTIAPKYVPPTDDSVAAKKIASIDYDFKTPAPLSFQLTTEMSTRILSVTSPSHAMLETTGGETAVAGTFVAVSKFGGRTTADLNRDIVVLVETSEANEARVTVEQGGPGGSSVLQLSYVPRFTFKPQGTELVFLVDCSGSMHGEGIQLASEALQLFLHSLPVDAFFNIYCFGSSYRSLFPESRRYDDDTLARAKQLAAQLAADLGGTEIYAPLEAIVKAAPISNSPRQIFVLTDGQVSNTSACIKLVGEHKDKNRVFTLGIGSAADRHLVKGMARAGQGTAVFTTAGESLAPKVLKQLKNAVQPCVQEFTIEWGESGAATAQAPGRLPPIYNGTRLQVFRLLDKTAPIPTVVKLAAKVGGSTFSQEITVAAGCSSSSLLLHKMFARKMIQDLEENYEEKEEGKKEEVKDLITDLGLKFGLATRHTSFIAVDSAAPSKEIPATMISRQVANQVAYGFGGFSGGRLTGGGGGGFGFGAPMAMCMAAAPPPMARMCFAAPQIMARSAAPPMMAQTVCFDSAPSVGMSNQQKMAPKPRFAKVMQECKMPSSRLTTDSCDSLDDSMEDDDQTTVTADSGRQSLSPKDTVLRVASIQSAQGSFAPSEVIVAALGDAGAKRVSLAELEAARPTGVGSVEWFTALVVVLLEERYTELRDYWELFVDKARAWLASKHSGQVAALEGLLAASKQLVIA